jgi:hypothetical protein
MFSDTFEAKEYREAYLPDHRYDTVTRYRIERQNDSYVKECLVGIFIGSAWPPG